MLSATPKHLHPILGRRMVDWIVEAARPLGAEPLIVVASPDTADRFEGLTVAVQEQPDRDRGRGSQRSVGARRRRRGAGSLRRHATPDHRAPRGPDRHAPDEGRGRDRSLVRPVRHPQLRPDHPRARRRSRGDRRGGRRVTGAARGRRGELVDLRLPGRSALAGARPAEARQRTGGAVSHGRRSRSRRRGPDRRRACRGRPRRDGGRQHAARARRRRRRAAGTDQRGSHARRGHDRRSCDHLDRADGETRAGYGGASLHVAARRTRASPKEPRSALMQS